MTTHRTSNGGPTVPDARPPHPDDTVTDDYNDIARGIFGRIMAAEDPDEMAHLDRQMVMQLAIHDPERPDTRPAPSDHHADGSAPVDGVGVQEAPRPYRFRTGDVGDIVDRETGAQTARVRYDEIDCPDHGIEERFTFVDAEGDIVYLAADTVAGILPWLTNRLQRVNRRRRDRANGVDPDAREDAE